VELGDPGVLEDLKKLLVMDCDWFFERCGLTTAYLSLSGEQGVGTLLDLVRSNGTAEKHRVPLMAGLADFLNEGHGRSHRTTLLDLAADESMTWQIRWLALECLDHAPGTADELAALLDSPDAYVATAAAATLAAWGAPTRLDVIRCAIMDGSVGADLRYTNEATAARTHSYAWPGRIARRLAKALAPYGTISIVQRFRVNADLPRENRRDAYEWLKAFDSEAWVDSYVGHLTDRTMRDSNRAGPTSIPKSRASAVLRVIATDFSARSKKGQSALLPPTRRLLRNAASAAEDIDSLKILLSMIANFGELGEEAHSAAYAVSRRARVRVFLDHKIEPLP